MRMTTHIAFIAMLNIHSASMSLVFFTRTGAGHAN